MKYRVDNIPWFFRPFFLLFSWSIAIFCFLAFAFIHLTCRIQFSGKEHLAPNQNYIFCFWHNNLPAYFSVFIRHDRPQVWMNHPAWFMKPIHLILRFMGIKELILGSTGHSGQEAANQLVERLKQGFSTSINPDGPAGPRRQLKKGVLHMASQSGVPILPLEIKTSHAFTLKRTWDQKRIPLPFARIQVLYKAPIVVTQETIETVSEKLVTAMG